MSPDDARAVLLVGMMAAGKTTVGRALADRLGWRYVDNDAQVVEDTGCSVTELLEAGGETALRQAESAALGQALTLPRPLVISVAGGAVLDAANRRLMAAEGDVVWLRAAVDTLARRVGSGGGRPWLGADPRDALERLEAVRRPLLASVAGLVLDVDRMSLPQVVEAIVGWLDVPARSLPKPPAPEVDPLAGRT